MHFSEANSAKPLAMSGRGERRPRSGAGSGHAATKQQAHAPGHAAAPAALPSYHQTQLKDHFKVVKHAPVPNAKPRLAAARSGSIASGLMQLPTAAAPHAQPCDTTTITTTTTSLGGAAGGGSAATFGPHAPLGCQDGYGSSPWDAQGCRPLSSVFELESRDFADDDEASSEASDDSNGCPSVCQAPAPKRARGSARIGAARTAAAAPAAPEASEEVSGAVCGGGATSGLGGRAACAHSAQHARQQRRASIASGVTFGTRGTNSCMTDAPLFSMAVSGEMMAHAGNGADPTFEDDETDDTAIAPIAPGPTLNPIPSDLAAAAAPPATPRMAPWAWNATPPAGQALSTGTGTTRMTSAGPTQQASNRWGGPPLAGGAAARRRRSSAHAATMRSSGAARTLGDGVSQQVSSAAGDDECSDDALSSMRRVDEGVGAAAMAAAAADAAGTASASLPLAAAAFEPSGLLPSAVSPLPVNFFTPSSGPAAATPIYSSAPPHPESTVRLHPAPTGKDPAQGRSHGVAPASAAESPLAPRLLDESPQQLPASFLPAAITPNSTFGLADLMPGQALAMPSPTSAKAAAAAQDNGELVVSGVGGGDAAAAINLLDDPLEGVPWSGPVEERPYYYQSRYEQLLYGINLVPAPMRASYEDEE